MEGIPHFMSFHDERSPRGSNEEDPVKDDASSAFVHLRTPIHFTNDCVMIRKDILLMLIIFFIGVLIGRGSVVKSK